VPISLGDSYRGFRVAGTTDQFFEHLRFGREGRLEFARGGPFRNPLEAVLGAVVARETDRQTGDSLVIAHGDRDDGITRHDELPFTVSGVLAPTGTPTDRTVYVPLEGIEAIHVGWESGTRIGDRALDAADVPTAGVHPEQITAFFLGLERRSDVLQIQRAINRFPEEPLLAIVPGVALTELWGLFGTAELALIAVAAMTVLTGLLGMVVGIFSTLNERRREMAVLRSVGARPVDIAALLVTESTLIGLTGAAAGYALLTICMLLGNSTVGADIGIRLSAGLPDPREAGLLAAVVVGAMLTGTLPAWRAYRLSLHDGLTANT
jgi:putative ABC transport system permease protein